ncbi:MAG: hypothetical protein WD851_05775 [Pirellulales bacterium]
MRNEAGEIVVNRTAQRAFRASQTATPVVTEMDLKIVDAAFADLETTILRCDNPVAQNPAADEFPAYQGVVQLLASQLRTLDDQRRHLATLLRDLQTPVPADA